MLLSHHQPAAQVVAHDVMRNIILDLHRQALARGRRRLPTSGQARVKAR